MIAQLNLKDIVNLNKIGGVLDYDPTKQRSDSWPDFIQNFDLDDPEVSEFIDEWRKYLDAKNRFNQLVEEKNKKYGK